VKRKRVLVHYGMERRQGLSTNTGMLELAFGQFILRSRFPWTPGTSKGHKASGCCERFSFFTNMYFILAEKPKVKHGQRLVLAQSELRMS